MFSVNEYFEGRVKSLAFETEEGPATLGVMAAGEFEFGTSTVEIMQVVSGAMDVKLPGREEWQTFRAGERFRIEADQKFQLRIASDTAYLCLYK
jgi:uncharacterized protein YaiE (UPF0345 family)